MQSLKKIHALAQMKVPLYLKRSEFPCLLLQLNKTNTFCFLILSRQVLKFEIDTFEKAI